MRELKNKLTSGKNTKNIQQRRGKSFGYQVLGFGAGEAAVLYSADMLIIGGGASGGQGNGDNGVGGGGAGGSSPSPEANKRGGSGGSGIVIVRYALS